MLQFFCRIKSNNQTKIKDGRLKPSVLKVIKVFVFVDVSVPRDGSFSFFFKQSFRYKNDDEKMKNETIVFKNDSF